MDSKTLYAIIGVVAIVAIIGGALLVAGNPGNSNNDDLQEDGKVTFKFNNEIRLAVFGNADGNDHLDQNDIKTLEDIISGKQKYDSKKNCFADTNADGYLNNEDVILLKKLVNKEECELYYYNAASEVAKINYPLVGKIATHHVYPLDACIILGIYDDVVGMSNQGFSNSVGRDANRYPGIGTSIANIGTPHEDPQAFLSSGADILLSPWDADYSKLETIIKSGNLDTQIVKLPMSKNSAETVDQYASLLMLGVMTQKEEAAHKYIDYIDEIQKYINEKVSTMDEKYTFITPFTSTKDGQTTIKLDSPYTNGSAPGDVYTISKLPMESANLVVDSGCPEVSLEWVYAQNPDAIFIIMFHDSSYTIDDIQKNFEQSAKVFEQTEAYKNGKVYGVNYYNIANYCGIPQLAVLAEYIWPELFDEEKCWNYLTQYFEEFTAYTDTSLEKLGSSIPYKLPEVA